MKRKSTISTILILLGLGVIFLSLAVLKPPLEIPWDNPDYWESNSTNDPQLEQMYDADLSDNVMILYDGDESAHFTLRNPRGGLLVTDEKYLKILSFNIKAENARNFKLLIHIETTNGHVYIYGEPVNYKRGESSRRNYHYGLGKDIRDGNWHSVFIDIEKELQNMLPSAQILGIKAIRFTIPKGDVGGNLLVNNIGFFSSLLEDAKKTKSRWEWTQEYKYDKNGRHKECTLIFYNEFGEAIRTMKIHYNYDKEGRKELTTYITLNSDNEIIEYQYSKHPKTRDYDIAWASWCYDRDWNLKKNAVTLWRSKGDNIYYMILYKGNKVMYIYEIHQILDESGYSNIYKFHKPALSNRWDGLAIRDVFVSEIDINNPDFDYKAFFDGLLIDFDCQLLGEVTWDCISENGNYIESISTSKDPSGNIISTDTRFHSEPFWNPLGKWGVKEYSKVKEIRYKNLSGNRWMGLGLDSRLECNLERTRMKYYIHNDEDNLFEIWTITAGEITKDIYDPTNLDNYHITLVPGWEEDNKIESQKSPLDNLVIGGDMRLIKPFWIHDDKVNCEIMDDGIRIERLQKDEGDKEPGYAWQYIPVQGGSYKLSVEYRREFGEAHIRGDWVALENLWTRDKPDEFAENLFEFKDDHNVGTQTKELIFTAPDEPGLLILKIGAASAVVYSYVGLSPYEPESLAFAVETTETITQAEVEQVEQIPSEEEYGSISAAVQEDSSGNVEVVYQERHINTPVPGGYIILKVDEDGNEEINENKTIAEELPGGDIKHIRTIVGSAFRKVIEEEPGVSGEELEAVIHRTRRKEGIASIQKEGSKEHLSYGLHVRGPGVDKLEPQGYNNIAPASILSKRDKNKMGIGYRLIRVILRFNDWLTNLIREFKGYFD